MWDALFLAVLKDISNDCNDELPPILLREGPSERFPDHAEKYSRVTFTSEFVSASDIFSALQLVARQ